MAQHMSPQKSQAQPQAQPPARRHVDVGGILLIVALVGFVALLFRTAASFMTDLVRNPGGLFSSAMADPTPGETIAYLLLFGGILLTTELCALASRGVGRPNPLMGAQLVKRKGDRMGTVGYAWQSRALLIIVVALSQYIVFVRKTCIELKGEPMRDWATLWSWGNPWKFLFDYTAVTGLLLDWGVKICLILGAVMLVLYAMRSDAIPWALGRALAAVSRVGLVCTLSYLLASFLSDHGHGEGLGGGIGKGCNLLGFLVTALPGWVGLLIGVVVIGMLCGGFMGDDSYGGGGGFGGGGGSDDYAPAPSSGWHTGDIVHDSEGHTGRVRVEGDFVIIDRDDGTQDTVYGEGPGSSFTSSNGHRYWS